MAKAKTTRDVAAQKGVAIGKGKKLLKAAGKKTTARKKRAAAPERKQADATPETGALPLAEVSIDTPKHAGGRPTKYTPETVEAICRAVEGGMSYSRAATLAGVSPQALSDWRHEIPEFAEKLEFAKATGIQKRLAEIDAAVTPWGATDWKAKAWILEKMAPEEFGKKLAVDTTVKGTVNVVLSPGALESIQARRRAQQEKLHGK